MRSTSESTVMASDVASIRLPPCTLSWKAAFSSPVTRTFEMSYVHSLVPIAIFRLDGIRVIEDMMVGKSHLNLEIAMK